MAKKKTVLKVSINCEKCKTIILKAITKLEGIEQITIDAEKGNVTVLGEVDPICLTEAIRKSGKYATIVTVGPPKPPEPTKPNVVPVPPYCKGSQIVVVNADPYDGGPGLCVIL